MLPSFFSLVYLSFSECLCLMCHLRNWNSSTEHLALSNRQLQFICITIRISIAISDDVDYYWNNILRKELHSHINRFKDDGSQVDVIRSNYKVYIKLTWLHYQAEVLIRKTQRYAWPLLHHGNKCSSSHIFISCLVWCLSTL